APTLVLMLYAPQPSPKIPLWEQQLSVGAVGMNLLHAAHAHGFVGNWLTCWPATSAAVAHALGATGAEDRMIGFFYIGTPSRPLDERPRPDAPQIVRLWDGKSATKPAD
ncbi:MAG: nitroreductase family protein, partial [Sphingopyxis sp.]